MKILYLAHRIPYPPNKGDKLRAFRQIEHLARHHKVWCACFFDDPADSQHVEALRQWCRDVVALRIDRRRALLRGLIGLARGRTLTESFYEHAPMRAALAELSQATEFDCVVAFSSSMAPFALSVPARRHVLDLCDLDSRKWLDYENESRVPLKWLYATEARRLARKEIEWIHRFDASILITKAETQHLDGAIPPGKLHIVGNGVEHQSLATNGNDTDTTVGFVGVMDYKPNVDAVVWFVKNCWPAIRRVHPRAVFRIIGRSPASKVTLLGSVTGVQIVGEVESVVDQLRNIAVSVAPLRIARGLQNKVLEAMAAAKPVVLTSGAAQGIDANSGEHFIIADDAEETIRTVNRLLADSEQRYTVGRAAKTFVDAHHCWDRELVKFEQIVTGAIATRVGGHPDLRRSRAEPAPA